MKICSHSSSSAMLTRPSPNLLRLKSVRLGIAVKAAVAEPPSKSPYNDDGGWGAENDPPPLVSKTRKIKAPPPKLTQDYGTETWQKIRSQVVREHDYFYHDQVEGTLPDELANGTLLLTSPGPITRFGHTARSDEDADGMVTALAMEQGKPVFFRSRMVRTNIFQREQTAGRRLSRGFHDTGLLTGTNPLNGWVSNPFDVSFPGRGGANTLYWGKKLYALSEHALPWELRLDTLDTVKEVSLGNNTGPPALVARYHIIPAAFPDGSEPVTTDAHHLVLMRTAQVGLDTLVTFTELDEEGEVVYTQQHRLKQTVSRMVQDFVVTGDRIAVLAPPVNFNLGRFTTQCLTGSSSFADCMDWDASRASELHVLPRFGGGRPMHMELPPLCMITCVNAYDVDDSSRLVLDMIATQGLPYVRLTNRDTMQSDDGVWSGQPKPELTRVEVDCVTGELIQAGVVTHRSLLSAAVAPGWATYAHEHTFATASVCDDPMHWGPAQVVMKLSVGQTGAIRSATWTPGPGYVLGAVAMVPKQDAQVEDDAWLITTLHAPGPDPVSKVLILDASDIPAGPVCSIPVKGLMPGPTVQWITKYLGPRTIPVLGP